MSRGSTPSRRWHFLILTRLGVPVSTTFLVLTVFAVTGGEPGNLGAMLIKSSLGYVVAFVAAITLFLLVFKRASEYFHRTQGREIPNYWVVLAGGRPRASCGASG